MPRRLLRLVFLLLIPGSLISFFVVHLVLDSWLSPKPLEPSNQKIRIQPTLDSLILEESIQQVTFGDGVTKAFIAGNLNENYGKFWLSLKEWEPETFRVLRAFVNEQTVYVDFGAWEGPTLLFAAQYAKRSIALEPDPYAYSVLHSFVGLNPAINQRISLLHLCVSDKQEAVVMSAKGASVSMLSRVGRFFVDIKFHLGEGSAYWVDCKPLPMILEEQQVPDEEPLFVKMDVEGFELYLLPNLTTWVKERAVKPVFWVSMHLPVIEASLDQKLAILEFVQLFRFCGFGIRDLVDCRTFTEQLFVNLFEFLLTDYLPQQDGSTVNL